ncbi:MAG: SRPBCC family protein [Pirellulales bacterium]|nr:SRPBCC family protein [Pirellulales bacterium]
MVQRGAGVTTFNTSREIPATAEQVFAAFSDPERLARWWGPAGFTNTFRKCEFHSGGRWSYVMHGPQGIDYPNESMFAEVDAPRRVVVQHISEPKYRLTVEFSSSAGGTVVSWSQKFESEIAAQRLEHIVVPANEQNLDRLCAEVSRKPGEG